MQSDFYLERSQFLNRNVIFYSGSLELCVAGSISVKTNGYSCNRSNPVIISVFCQTEPQITDIQLMSVRNEEHRKENFQGPKALIYGIGKLGNLGGGGRKGGGRDGDEVERQDDIP